MVGGVLALGVGGRYAEKIDQRGKRLVTTMSKSALVSYSAAQMYDLVNDIDAYPRFLPWCRATQVLYRDDDEVRASIDIAKGRVNKSFTTSNRLQRNKQIEIKLIEGPFRRLEGYWRFQPLREDACKVTLDVDFEFSNVLLRMAIGPVFSQIVDTLVDSFCKRATEIYG